MEQIRLFNLLRNDLERREAQVNIVEAVLSTTLEELAKQVPEKAEVFNGIASTMKQSLHNQRPTAGYILNCFSGQGPVASKLREFALAHVWFYSEPGAKIANPLQVEMLKRLELFDMRPLSDPDNVNQTIEFLNQAIARVRTGFFGSPLAPMTKGDHAPEEFQTGIYGEPGNGDKHMLVLRVGSPGKGELQAIFKAESGYPPSLWLHHPWEDVWYQTNDFQLTFTGLREKLAEQLEVALKNANGAAEHFDVEKEMEELNHMSQTIFDNEMLLPDRVITEDQSLVYMSYNEVQSEITVSWSPYMLSFMNTRGSTPSRPGGKIFSIFPVTAGYLSIDPKEIPLEVLQAIVNRAKQVLSMLARRINESAGEGAKLQKRQAVTQTSEGAVH